MAKIGFPPRTMSYSGVASRRAPGHVGANAPQSGDG
jgi:hypothetical protein